ncbi:MAG: ferrochelatase [Candidatus Obscuribacterales bacterium]|nr:ferrochelatase [Candidatus Obscuribacterales bacterium]
MHTNYDAILILSFGGPEGMDDVMPFLENVTRGRNIPVERLQAVAHHYEIFGGVSPINAHNRALISALKGALDREGLSLPIYWGNRNWHPFVEDTFKEMTAAGVQKVLAFVTSAYASYSGCRMYLNDIDRAKAAAGAGSPIVHKLPLFFDHPLFIEANSDHLLNALNQLPPDRAQSAQVVFTAHSVPKSMADNCDYEKQLAFTASRICERTGRSGHAVVYQSRSGPPSQPWLGPDICDYLKEFAAGTSSTKDVIVLPLGFISDHMEVMYDIEVEAKQIAAECGLNLIRAATAGTHPAFVQMIVELIKVRLQKPEPDNFVSCPADCCPAAAPGAPSRPLHTQGGKHD